MSAEEIVQERPNVVMLDEVVEQPKADEAKEEATEDPKQEQQEEVSENTEEGQERDDAGKFKPKNATQARIDELTRQKHEQAREAAYWRGLAEQRAAKETAPVERPQGKPSADQFEDHSEYVEALTDWKVKQALAERDAQTQETARAMTWEERKSAAKVEIPDFEEVVTGSTAPMSTAMAEAIKESDMGPKVLYHLAQHPEEAARLANLSPVSAAREIGKIEATLSAAKVAAPAPRVTAAPKPAAPIGSGRSTEGDPSKMSMADYQTWRAQQLKQR